MFIKKKIKTSVKKISNFINLKFTGKDFNVSTFSSLNKPEGNSVCFYTDILNANYDLKDNVKYNLNNINKLNNIFVITDKQGSKKITVPHVISKNPRIDFQIVANKFFIRDQYGIGIHKKAIVEKNTKIGKNVYIGANSYVGDGVIIGDGTKILQNVVILGKTTIGKNCRIKPNTTIGGEGFSFAYHDKQHVHFSHTGNVKIGNNVWIGSNTTVEKATIDSTIISDNVKIDDLVHIGHNSFLGEYTQITVGSIIAGRAKTGKKCWVAPNAVIENGCSIGNNCLVGTHSLVRTNFKDNCMVIGSPAKILKKIT